MFWILFVYGITYVLFRTLLTHGAAELQVALRVRLPTFQVDARTMEEILHPLTASSLLIWMIPVTIRLVLYMVLFRMIYMEDLKTWVFYLMLARGQLPFLVPWYPTSLVLFTFVDELCQVPAVWTDWYERLKHIYDSNTILRIIAFVQRHKERIRMVHIVCTSFLFMITFWYESNINLSTFISYAFMLWKINQVIR